MPHYVVNVGRGRCYAHHEVQQPEHAESDEPGEYSGTAHMVRWQPEIHALRTSGDVAIQPVWLGVRDQGLGAGGVRVEGLVPDLL